MHVLLTQSNGPTAPISYDDDDDAKFKMFQCIVESSSFALYTHFAVMVDLFESTFNKA